MTAQDERRRYRQEVAVVQLLTQPTIAAAAKSAGVGEKTLRRWIHDDPEFQARYRAAREIILRQAVGRLQGHMAGAVETLARAMTCGTPPVEVRAAVALLDHAFRGAELFDLTERVRALEDKTSEEEVPYGE